MLGIKFITTLKFVIIWSIFLPQKAKTISSQVIYHIYMCVVLIKEYHHLVCVKNMYNLGLYFCASVIVGNADILLIWLDISQFSLFTRSSAIFMVRTEHTISTDGVGAVEHGHLKSEGAVVFKHPVSPTVKSIKLIRKKSNKCCYMLEKCNSLLFYDAMFTVLYDCFVCLLVETCMLSSLPGLF